jgi:hypothetical protein
MLHLRTKEFTTQRRNFTDRAQGSIADGYSSFEEFVRIAAGFFSLKSEICLRDRLAFLLCHHGLLRGQDVRELELADLVPVELSNEGPSRCIALVLMLHQGRFQFAIYCQSL